MDGGLAAGAYQSLHTAELERRLQQMEGVTPHFQALAPAEAPDVLARHVAAVVRQLLVAEKEPHERARLVGDLLDYLGASQESHSSQPSETASTKSMSSLAWPAAATSADWR